MTDPTVRLAGVQTRVARPGFVFSREGVESDHIVTSGRIRLTHPALTAVNLARSRWSGESADGAWSLAERIAHRLLRQADITGWYANHDVWIRGRRYTPDIAFPRARGCIEVDGKAFHLDRFEEDRSRQNVLTAAGWWVLRWTWEMLTTRPDAVIAQLRATLGR